MPMNVPADKNLTSSIFLGVIVSLSMLLVGCGGGSSSTSTPATPENTVTWTWMGGSNSTNSGDVLGSYGTQGVSAAGNVPAARGFGASWTDPSGNLWLFGGQGCVLVGTVGECGWLNDLWEYSPTTGTWGWMNGSDTPGMQGTYGTQGVAAASNVPGARMNPVSWRDTKGNLWLFGGTGIDSTGAGADLNDLWEYDSTAKTWTWVSGSNVVNSLGTYGTQGVPAATNLPGARDSSVSWTDSSGAFWLFGGLAIDSAGTSGVLNDLWEYRPTTKTWVWVSGSNVANTQGVYGTKGVAATTNVPPPRWSSISWIDSGGNLWLFGGSDVANKLLNDLWVFNPAAKTWTWVSGSNTINANGVYGTKGVAATTNVPTPRWGAANWIDSSGNFWIFGGVGLDSTGTQGRLNDLWEYNPLAKTWTWVSGSNVIGALGVYGTERVAADSNVPGARFGSFSWTDSSGNFWLFGSLTGYATEQSDNGPQNDLWRASHD